MESAIETKITGKIPEWLCGVLYRNGPGRFEFNGKSYEHLFDGQACVHKFKIDEGQVFYSNKLLETKCYTRTLEQNRLHPNFGQPDPSNCGLSRAMRFLLQPETNDNVNVSIFPFGNTQLFALTETNLFCQLNPNDLSIKKTFDIRDKFLFTKTSMAHPQIEPDGSWITIGMNPVGFPYPHYDIIRFKNRSESLENEKENEPDILSQAEMIVSLPSSHCFALSYYHSFALTQNYIVFLEQSVILDFIYLFYYLVSNGPLTNAFRSNDNFRTRIHLINRQTGEIHKNKYETEAQFCFHIINSYEDSNEESGKNEIIIDLCSYEMHEFDINNFTIENLFTIDAFSQSNKLKKPRIRRIRVPLEMNLVRNSNELIECHIEDLFKSVSLELPAINFKHNGLKYTYFYGVNYFKRPFSIVKLNVLDKKEIYEMKYSGTEKDDHQFPSEPVFVERPNPTSEDDGVLLVMVLSDQTDFLSILDARDLKELARAELPEDVRGAFTFHGFFADRKTFKKLF
jgi:carotenoid cleavage dioxygenase-like enzyme